MRSFKNSLTVLAVILGLAVAAHAGETEAKKTADAPKELKHQTNCPVMGGKIDSSAYTDIQGQRVYHCCPMCTKKLQADPDKYFEEAAAQGILFENIQTTCTVSGMELKDKSIYTDYKGRRLAFCSEAHRDAFNADPVKYLKKLDEQSAAQENKADEKTEMKDMKDMDHSGDKH
jgi:YHS domain-containing protein